MKKSRVALLVLAGMVVAAVGSGEAVAVMNSAPKVDRHSYLGGVKYATVRWGEDPLTGKPATQARIVSACTAYLDAGMNTLDGYRTAGDFLAGCREAAHEFAPQGGQP